MFDRINWEDRGRQPMYDFLYSVIRDRILGGVLRPGEKLPSKRSLSEEYGIALVTVENAYAQLIAEGYLETRERRGYYVSDQISILGKTEPDSSKEKSVQADRGRGTHFSGEYPPGGSGNETDAEAETSVPAEENNSMEVIADLASNQIFRENFPFATWARLLRQILSSSAPGLQNTPPPQGVKELREAIRDYLKISRGLTVDAERIIIGPGTEYLHLLLLQLLEDPAVVAVEDPGYKKIGQIYQTFGRPTLPIPVDEDGLRVDSLEGSRVKLIHTSPSHHFPTGAIMPAYRRLDLIRFAVREECTIIEDDYDSEFRFTGRPIPPLAAMDPDHVIYMNTFTRTLSPSIRIAYMVLPKRLLELYRLRLSFYAGSVSSLDQYALAAFLKEGYYERHLSRMRTYYKQQRKLFREQMTDSSLSKVAYLKEDPAGLSFLLQIPGIPAEKEEHLVSELRKKGVLVRALNEYYYDGGRTRPATESACLILNHASVSEEEWKAGLKAISETISKQASVLRS